MAAIYTPSLPFEVRCESGILTDIHPKMMKEIKMYIVQQISLFPQIWYIN